MPGFKFNPDHDLPKAANRFEIQQRKRKPTEYS